MRTPRAEELKQDCLLGSRAGKMLKSYQPYNRHNKTDFNFSVKIGLFLFALKCKEYMIKCLDLQRYTIMICVQDRPICWTMVLKITCTLGAYIEVSELFRLLILRENKLNMLLEVTFCYYCKDFLDNSFNSNNVSLKCICIRNSSSICFASKRCFADFFTPFSLM